MGFSTPLVEIRRSCFIYVAEVHEDKQHETNHFAETESNSVVQTLTEKTCNVLITSLFIPFESENKSKLLYRNQGAKAA